MQTDDADVFAGATPLMYIVNLPKKSRKTNTGAKFPVKPFARYKLAINFKRPNNMSPKNFRNPPGSRLVEIARICSQNRRGRSG